MHRPLSDAEEEAEKEDKARAKQEKKEKKEDKKKAAKDKKDKKKKKEKEKKETKKKKELQNGNVKLVVALNIEHELSQKSDQEPVVVPARVTTLGAIRDELQRSGLTKTLT